MSFLDFLKEKSSDRDYAQEFKDAFENQEHDKLSDIVSEWKEYDTDDANLTLARVILETLNASATFSKTFEIYMSAMQEKPTNTSLFDWFNTKALSLMEKRADDEIGFSVMFNNRYKSKGSQNSYAKEFLKLFEDIVDNDDVGSLDELKNIMGKWQEECPQDANMHCAYVVLNIMNMFQNELDDRIKQAEECTPADKNSYAKLLSIMHGVCRAKA